MNHRFITGWLLLFLTILGFSTVPVFAAEQGASREVQVYPFAVEGGPQDDSLGLQIAQRIVRELESAGLSVKISPTPPLSDRDVPAMMILAKAKAVIWGKLTVSGSGFSLTGRLFVDGREYEFTETRASIESLFGAVQILSQKFANLLVARETVTAIEIHGNERIEAEAILRVVQSGPGDVYLKKTLSEDLKAIYAMGYFDDVQVAVEERGQGKVVLFTVKEKPTVRQVFIRGNKAIANDKILAELTTKDGSILNVFQVRRDMEKIRDLYRGKNYHHADISYEITEKENNQADLLFSIHEGKKVKIAEITFEGAKSYKKRKLKKQIESSEKGWFSWLSGSGEIKREQVEQDAARLLMFYHNEGFADARVAEPVITMDEAEARIVFKIVEGERYKISDVTVSGDLLFPEETLVAITAIGKEKWYKRDTLQKDILAISDLYGDMGYANADVYPRLKKDPDAAELGVEYVVHQGNQVYINRILIDGNERTRDKVIRRQLPIVEQELYSGSKIKRGTRNLNRLEYFENVSIEPEPTADPEKVDLRVNVKEKATGMFTFGAGYSSEENVFVQASVSQRNLFGRGQTMNLQAAVGSSTTRYTLSFTEPYLFDLPLSAGFDVYNWEREYDDYTKDSTGFTIRFGYPVWDYTRFYISYGFEKFDVEVDSGEEYYVNQDILDLVPLDTASSLTARLVYDSTNRMFNATEGATHSATIKYSGGFLGGDIAFTKYLAETGWYYPLFWDLVFFAHAEGGYIDKGSDGHLPDYEKFYLGGMNSVRGYDWRDIAIYYDDIYTDSSGNRHTVRKNKGGDKFFQVNLEVVFPLVKDAGLMGVVFYDMGNIYDDGTDLDAGLKRSYGGGIRWFSPVGPIRLEYGYPLDKIDGESQSGRWEFSMGSAF
ncbi:outer membrane protein assembly factor BamA [Desulfococcaceae bacterium OttesenSCG-928-F15]|nr:outer membrane protein assembly factor BamA [Desulfococcaceae bacterium OttesenSCG-928-F15]